MCFSATASFVSGGLLLGLGCVNLIKEKPLNKTHILASIPVLFGVQQIAEGMVWLGIDYNVPLQIKLMFAYLFSFFATSVWPALLPFACYHFETSLIRKRLLFLLTLFGLILSIYLFWASFFYSSIEVQVKCNKIDCSSLAYLFETPYSGNWINFLYLFFVIAPLFTCSNNRIRFFVGPAFFFSFILGAFLSNSETFPSVWCFFAAIMSLSIVYVYYDNHSNSSYSKSLKSSETKEVEERSHEKV